MIFCCYQTEWNHLLKTGYGSSSIHAHTRKCIPIPLVSAGVYVCVCVCVCRSAYSSVRAYMFGCEKKWFAFFLDKNKKITLNRKPSFRLSFLFETAIHILLCVNWLSLKFDFISVLRLETISTNLLELRMRFKIVMEY